MPARRLFMPFLTLGAITLLLATGPLLAGPAHAAEPSVVVRTGDTLTAIAARFGLSVEAVADLNGIPNPNLIYPGQRLRLRSRTATSSTEPAGRPLRHVVGIGETLTGIAVRYGSTIAAIASANHIADPSLIRIGQVLVVGRAPVAHGLGAARHGGALPADLGALMARHAGVRATITAEARRFGVSTSLALALAWLESGWRQDRRSSAGAVGVMQLLPTTADWIGDTMLGRPVHVRTASDNVRAGVVLLRHYLIRYGDVRRALAAYYQGQRSVDTLGILPVSMPYIASILALQAMLA